MPTNLPPDYYEIEKRFRIAETAAEKISLLEEMYSVVPKHKGTDHLRADLRRQLSKLKGEALQSHKKHGGQSSQFHIEREGAGQVVLIGATNTGKSALVKALTHAVPEVSAAPFSTWKPTPGMMHYENVQIQLIDTPALDKDGYLDPGLFDLIRRADLMVLVVDLQADPFQQLNDSLELLKLHRIFTKSDVETIAAGEKYLIRPMIVLANKCDDDDDLCELFCELIDHRYQVIPVSAETGRGLSLFRQRIYAALGVIRVYARPPGKEPDLERPFVLKHGETVEDLARKIHKDFYENLKSARVWGSSAFDGQMVTREFVLQDGDIIELKA